MAELSFAALLWGLGFVFVRYALETLPPFWLTTLRFSLHLLFALPFLFILPNVRSQINFRQWWIAAIPGCALGAALIFQTFGLRYTLVSKSGFITVLYIVFVPVLEGLWLKKSVKKVVWISVALALLGAFLMSGFESGQWNLGDLLTLGCALLSAFQIVGIERASKEIESPFLFNAFQSFWAAVVPLPFLFTETLPAGPWPHVTWISLLGLSLVSTHVAFMIQVRAQRIIPSSTVSMLFLLESPFAAAFAYVFFREVLSPMQWLGGLLIIAAAILAIRKG